MPDQWNVGNLAWANASHMCPGTRLQGCHFERAFAMDRRINGQYDTDTLQCTALLRNHCGGTPDSAHRALTSLANITRHSGPRGYKWYPKLRMGTLGWMEYIEIAAAVRAGNGSPDLVASGLIELIRNDARSAWARATQNK